MNYYPTYQPMYYQPPMQDQLGQLRQNQFQQQPAGPVDDRIWVQGYAAAQAYLVAANGFVRLWDSTAPVFYEKQADASGRPFDMVAYRYERVNGASAAPVAAAPDYAAQLASLEERIAALEKGRGAEKEETVNG